MSVSPVHNHKSTVRSASMLSAFLRHLNMGTVAFVLFVALALLNPVRGKEPKTTESARARDTEPQLATGLSTPDSRHGKKFNVTNSLPKISGIKSLQIGKHR